jgi:hypothetical protein
MNKVTDIIATTRQSALEVMRGLVGQSIFTFHGGLNLEYQVNGITQLPLRFQRVGHESMRNYFKRKHDIRLDYLSFPCFETVGTQIIPLELAFVEDNDDC